MITTNRSYIIIYCSHLTQKYVNSYVTVEHVLPPKNAMSLIGFDPRTSRIVRLYQLSY